jgi:Leucine-rich repeat (LRR) protein
VQVYDDDETLLAGPSPEELAARPVVQRTRFWLQFDMQSLFLLVVVVSCAASCYAIHCRRLLPQQRAVGQLETFRPAIDFFGNVPFAVDFSKCGTKPSDDDLACLESLDQLTSVNLSGSPISDVGIEHLKGLRYLNFIDCEDTKVTAKGAEELHRALPKAFISYGSAKKPIVLKPPDEK